MAYASLHKSHMQQTELRITNAYKCLRVVQEVLPFRSAVDFGCGIGGWLVAAKDLGAKKVLGLEGDWIKGRETLLAEDELVISDLAKEPPKFGRTFDIAMSIEVAEHLPPESADLFVDALCDAAELVVFSAATPGQGGINHLNEQKHRYWVDKFWDRGFVGLEMIRPAIVSDQKMFSWLKTNLMVFSSYPLLCMRNSLKGYMMPKEYFYNRFRPM